VSRRSGPAGYAMGAVMQSRRTVSRVTRPDLVVPGPADQAVSVPPDRAPAASANFAAVPPVPPVAPVPPVPPVRAAVLTRPRASQVTLPDGWPVAARPTPSPPNPPPLARAPKSPAPRNAPPKSPPPKSPAPKSPAPKSPAPKGPAPKGPPPPARAPKNPRRAAWPLAACLGALVVPAAIAVALALRAGGSSLPEEVMFGSMASPATGESATSTPSLNGSGVPFIDPGLGPRVTKGGTAHWAPGYPGLPGFFIPPPSAARPGAGRHRSHGGLGQPGNGNTGGHRGRGPTPKPTHSPGGSRGGAPTPKPPSKTPKPVRSSPTTTPPPSTPPASKPPASTPPAASAPPATRSP
jgi:hypothetical protein